jgi:hypothetical protein
MGYHYNDLIRFSQHHKKDYVKKNGIPEEMVSSVRCIENFGVVAFFSYRDYNTANMHSKVGKKYFIIPLLYILIISSLLYLQFQGEQNFSEVISGIQVEGTLPAGGTDRAKDLSHLELHFGYLSFSITEESPVRLVQGEEKTEVPLILRGFEEGEEEGELRVGLSKNVSILFKREEEHSLVCKVRLPEDLPANSRIVLPVSVEQDVEVVQRGRIPVYRLEGKEGFSYLTLSMNDSFRSDKGALHLRVDEGAVAGITYTWNTTEKIDPYSYWFTDVAFFISQDEYDQKVNSFIEETYNGLFDDRFYRTQGVWDRGGEPRNFSEIAAVTLLSEALDRDSYGRYVGTVKDAARAHEEHLTYFSNPFFGNIVETTEDRLEEERLLLASVNTFLDEDSEEVFTFPNLMDLLVHRAGSDLLEKFLQFCSEINPEEASIPAVLGMYRAYVESGKIKSISQAGLQAFSAIPEEVLLPAIAKTENGLFLRENGRNQDSSVDLYLSLQGGLQIKNYGEEKGDETLIKIGRTMIGSVLRLMEENGYIPARLALNEEMNEIVSMDGTIVPEEFYPLFKRNPYYPSYVPCPEVGKNTRIWRAAKVEQLFCDAEKIEIDFRFPAWGIHNVVIHDIPSVQSIEMHGLVWNSDRNFERYSDGWYFDEELDILYVKIQQRSDLNTIQINL